MAGNHRSGRKPPYLTSDQHSAITAMLPGDPVEVAPPWETGGHRTQALRERLLDIKVGERRAGPWQRSFRAFLREWVWTQDEARGGQVARFPDYPYIDEVCDALLTYDLLFIEKSRRVLASWTVCAFDLWVAAGGQDPRWPALMLSTDNRQVILAARKLKDLQGSAWFLRERVRFIYDQAIARGIQSVWPEFPTFEWTYAEARASNGARINAVPSGADQMRGPGATVVHCEETSFWPQARASLSGARPVTQGGGHIVLVSTAQGGTFAEDIRNGTIRHNRTAA